MPRYRVTRTVTQYQDVDAEDPAAAVEDAVALMDWETGEEEYDFELLDEEEE